MHRFAAIIAFALGTLAVRAQVAPRTQFSGDIHVGSGTAMHTSLSKQFLVREADNPGGSKVPLGKDTSVHYIRIDPTLLLVTCERIKHALLAEFGAADQWQEQIFIDLRRARTLNDTVFIDSEPYGHGWSYHVSLPDTVENKRLINSIVDVLLLEMANRNAARSAEIPLWLAQGLTEDIIRSSHIELVLEPVKPDANGLNIGMLTVAGTNINPLAIAHANLRAAPPLTVNELSWPDNAQLESPAGETYRSSAQLYVHELLQLRDGRAAMRAFIQELPQHLNWQLSFLHAFRTDFASQLELEKWWALRVVDFTGRDIIETWNVEESWQKLDDIIRPVVEVRTRVNELPLRTQMSLQMIIEKWDVPRQVGFLKERSKQLYALRSRVTQDLAKLTDDYRKTIDLYLERRMRDGYLRTPRAQEVLGPDVIDRETLAALNVLDSIGEDLRPRPQILQSADAGRTINH